MLNVDNLTFRYSKFSRPVLCGASLELKAFDKDEITITTKEANDWTIAMTLVLPILIAGCGIFVITRRKHS